MQSSKEMIPLTAIDNVISFQSAIWSIAKMLKVSAHTLDGTEVEGAADAMMEMVTKTISRCYDMQPDEDCQNEADINQRVETAKMVYDRALAMAAVRMDELKSETND